MLQWRDKILEEKNYTNYNIGFPNHKHEKLIIIMKVTMAKYFMQGDIKL